MKFTKVFLLLLSIVLFSIPQSILAQTICVSTGTQAVYLTTPRDDSTVTGMVNVYAQTSPGVTPSYCQYNEIFKVTVKGGPFQETLTYNGNYQSFDSGQLTPGEYRITVTYIVNNRAVYDSANVTIYRDEEGPEIFLPGTVDNAEWDGIETVQIDAYDPSGIQDVQILLGSTEVGYVDNEGAKYIDAPLSINTTAVPDGDYELIARATDTAGNISEYTLNVSVNNVDDAPVVNILSPAAGSEVSGTIRIRTNSTDDNGIKSLSCYIGGVLVSSTTRTPYDCVIDTRSYEDGPYQVAVVAKDTANKGDTKFHFLHFKNNANDAPTITLLSPTQGQTLSGTSNVLVDAQDDLAVKKVDYFLGELFIGSATTSPFTFSFNSANVADGVYQLKAIAHDFGDLTDTDYAIISIRNGDDEKPGVFITKPAELSILSGTVTVESLAVDNVSVKEVRYFLDDNLLAVKTIAPYAFKLETGLYPDGDHALTATAVDYANNKTSHTIQVTIDSFSPPTDGNPDDGTDDGTDNGTDDGTDNGTGDDGSNTNDDDDETLDDTVASLAENLNNLISTVDTLSENQSQIQEQIAAMQTMLNQLLEIFASAATGESAAMKANPRKAKRLTRKANKKVQKMIKAKRKRAFKKRKRSARRAIRRLKKFLAS